ncbi:sensor histidine kinase [Enterococcus sp.]
MTLKLKHINSVQTNAVIQLPSKNPYLVNLVLEVNRLIQLNKENYQQLIESQNQFDMAINNISHDIRTPLTVASGYAQILEKKSDDKQFALIKKVRVNLIDVEKKLEDLLTYNRLLEKRVETELVTINLSNLLENQVLRFYEAFQKEQIALELDIKKQLSLISDEKLVVRIIENALGNVLNHGTKQAKIKLEEEQEGIILRIDNQTTQKIDDYSKLFDRFYTEDFARLKKNSGLGLYIIKELTVLLNGEVTTSGNEDTFTLIVKLPKK